MKKHLIAAAALATLSTATFAQSATVYGILDLSVSKTTNTTASGGSTTGLTDAVWMPSIFGVTGTEDLGGGMKASFNLESDVRMDTGRLTEVSSTDSSATSATKLFGRKANVALSGNFGELKAGKDIDMIFLQGFIDNVRNSHSSSGFIAHTLATGCSIDTECVFTQNMVRYTTPSFNGFKASVQRKFGEQAGDTGTNSSTAYLVNYANGGLSLNAGSKQIETTSNAKSELMYLGGTYQLGAVRLSATYHKTQFKNGATANSSSSDIKTTEVGAGYAINPKMTAAVNYVKTEQGVNEGDITSASLKYSLSKRTSLWTMVARTNNDGFSIGGGNYNQGGLAGKDSTATSVGVTHSF
jgi:predicted porin